MQDIGNDRAMKRVHTDAYVVIHVENEHTSPYRPTESAIEAMAEPGNEGEVLAILQVGATDVEIDVGEVAMVRSP